MIEVGLLDERSIKYAASTLRTIARENLDGVVYATSSISDSRTTICVYGDPTGLRSFAFKLLKLAELNQSELDERSLFTRTSCEFL